MRKRKLLKTLGLTLVIGVVLVVLFVSAFIFNPFEGAVADMRDLVPRDVDFFVRKTDLADDFEEFPEPQFWNEIADSQGWTLIKSGPAYQELQRDGIERSIADLRRLSERIADDSGGFLGLMRDVLGTDLILAGRFKPPSLDATTWCAYTRVSWRVRFVWGLLEWDSVREQAMSQGVRIELDDQGAMSIEAPGMREVLHVARIRDCVIATNDPSFLVVARKLAQGVQDVEPFGGSSDYRDDIAARVINWQQRIDVPSLNVLETYLRPDQLFDATGWDRNWPDPRHPEDINQRVLAAFLNLRGWRFLTSSFVFETGSLSWLGKVELDPNKHSPFQEQFFQSEEADRDWIESFLLFVPQHAAAAAALRMPAGAFLRQMVRALDDAERRLLDEQIQRTGKYDSAEDLIAKVEIAFLPRTGFVFQRSVPAQLPTNEPSVAPHVAWVFWVRQDARQALLDLQDWLFRSHTRLGFANAYDLKLGGDNPREYASPNIPGTGSIALLLYGDFFIVSNFGPMLGQMLDARLGGRSLLNSEDYRVFEPELGQKPNAFVWFDAERIEEIFVDYVQELEAGTGAIDPAWLLENRPRAERDVLARDFAGVPSVSALNQAQQEQFEKAVMALLQQRWLPERNQMIGRDRGAFEQAIGLARMFRHAYLEFEFTPRSVQWVGGAIFEPR